MKTNKQEESCRPRTELTGGQIRQRGALKMVKQKVTSATNSLQRSMDSVAEQVCATTQLPVAKN
jgi:hypothetical protein